MSNWAAVKRRIVTIGTFALQGVDLGVTGRDNELVPVAYSSPPDEADQTCLYFAGIETTDAVITPAGMKRGAPKMDDSFTINGTIDVFGFDSDEDAEEAAVRVLNAFRSVLDRCRHLVDTAEDGVDLGEPSTYDVQSAYVSTARMTPYAPIGDTHVARISFVITCESKNA